MNLTIMFSQQARLSRFRLALLVACTVLLSASALAQTPAPPPPLLAGIAHVAIRVADLTRSQVFYQSLGFQAPFSMSSGGKPAQVFFKVNDEQFIELYPQHSPAQPLGFMHVCFQSTDLPSLYSAYVARGLSPTPVKRAGAGNLLFTLQGPEQQNIEYTQYMPGSMHTLDRGSHLGPTRIAQHILAVSLPMQNVAPAQSFYLNELSFQPALHPTSTSGISLLLPGTSGQQINIIPRQPSLEHAEDALWLVFSVPSLHAAASQLHQLHIHFDKTKAQLAITDPDGNHLIFFKSQSAPSAHP